MQGHRSPPITSPDLSRAAPVQRLAPRQGPTLAPNERFPKDFWLTPRTVLTRVTPISKLNHFCVRHGASSAAPIAPCSPCTSTVIRHST